MKMRITDALAKHKKQKQKLEMNGIVAYFDMFSAALATSQGEIEPVTSGVSLLGFLTRLF